MVSGMLSMVMAFTIAGVVQTYLWRVVGLDFMQVRTDYVTGYMVAVLAAGAVMFAPGALLFAWDFLRFGGFAIAPIVSHMAHPKAATPGVILLCLLGAPDTAWAHCDTLRGPVVAAARAALAANDVTPALRWVQPAEEQEVRRVFEKTAAIRDVNAAVRDVADTFFFETLVRLHRLGEGEPYTGLKDGAEGDPLIDLVDMAIASGDVEGVVAVVAGDVERAIRAQFASVRARRAHADDSVEAGREYVRVYVQLIHYVEGIHTASMHGRDLHGETGEPR
jgi:hypothetical protein